MSTLSAQPRVNKGRPAGGQWTSRHHEASELSDDYLTSLEISRIRRYVLGFFHNLRRADVDCDDVVQTVCVELVARRERVEAAKNRQAYVNVVVRNVVNAYWRGDLRHEDVAGFREVQRLAQIHSNEVGRELTSGEMDDLAALTRAIWHDPKHRPSPSFYTRASSAQVVPLDDLLHDRANSGIDEADDSPLYEQFATLYGLPSVDPHSLSRADVTRIRGDVTKIGGAQGALRAYQADPLTIEAGVLSFFEPWGRLHPRHRDDLVEQLARWDGDRIDAIWNQALRAAAKAARA